MEDAVSELSDKKLRLANGPKDGASLTLQMMTAKRAAAAEALVADMREALTKIQDLANAGMSHGLSADFTCEQIRDVADAILSRLNTAKEPERELAR
jgi:uncharacterized protein YoaH (UPF0181 family)